MYEHHPLQDKLFALSPLQYSYLLFTIATIPSGIYFTFPIATLGIFINIHFEKKRRQDYFELKKKFEEMKEKSSPPFTDQKS